VLGFWQIEEHRGALRNFFASLIDQRDYADAAALLELLSIHGNQLRPPQSKSIGEGLFELRGKQVRLFYVFRSGRRVVVLGGIVKKRSDIPRDVLDRMRRLARQVS
jgi:phage-related protein